MANGDTPKVTVIVPMYNLGAHVLPCLKSVLGQTYKNIELIVVDDGSTDDSASICAGVINGDERARLVQKENGGLSSARNYGLDCGTGDFVTFVDGDDVLDEWAIDHMIALAQKTGAPLVTCTYRKIDSADNFGAQEVGDYRVVSGKKLLEMLLLFDGESGSACAKLYSRELFPLLRFPEGQLFEDFGVEAKIFSSIDAACVSDAPLYGYLTREGSITTESKYGDIHREGMEASLAEVRKVVSRYPDLSEAFECFKSFCLLRVASRLDVDACEDRIAASAFVKAVRSLCMAASRNDSISQTWRIRCRLFAVSPSLHNLVYGMYGVITGKVAR